MKKLQILIFLLFLSFGLKAQILNPVKWSYAAKRTSATEAIVYIKATIDAGWHIYSAYQADGGPAKTSFSFAADKDYSLSGNIIEQKPITKFEDTFGMQVKYFEKSVVFSQKIKLKATTATVKGTVEFMVCTDKECLPRDEVAFSIPVNII